MEEGRQEEMVAEQDVLEAVWDEVKTTVLLQVAPEAVVFVLNAGQLHPIP